MELMRDQKGPKSDRGRAQKRSTERRNMGRETERERQKREREREREREVKTHKAACTSAESLRHIAISGTPALLHTQSHPSPVTMSTSPHQSPFFCPSISSALPTFTSNPPSLPLLHQTHHLSLVYIKHTTSPPLGPHL